MANLDPVSSVHLNRPDQAVQRAMNVVLPLRDPSPKGKASLTISLLTEAEAITSALRNTGMVHFARFNIVGPNLEFVSLYDGQATTYLTEFALQIGRAFDAVMRAAADWPPEGLKPLDISVSQCPAQFAEYIQRHDLYQLPEDLDMLLGDAVDHLDAGQPSALTDAHRAALERIFADRVSANLSAFVVCSGLTVAQMRARLGLGW